MTKKSKPEIKLGASVRLRAQSGEIIEGRVVHMWEEKSVVRKICFTENSATIRDAVPPDYSGKESTIAYSCSVH